MSHCVIRASGVVGRLLCEPRNIARRFRPESPLELFYLNKAFSYRLHSITFISKMASDRMWGGLPYIVPSKTAMKYLYHAKVIEEEEVPVGSHYRAREDMLQNVRIC